MILKYFLPVVGNVCNNQAQAYCFWDKGFHLPKVQFKVYQRL